MDLGTKKIATVLDTQLYDPRAIVVDPRDDQRWIYWTDSGFKHGKGSLMLRGGSTSLTGGSIMVRVHSH